MPMGLTLLLKDHAEFRRRDAATLGLFHFKLCAGVQTTQRVEQRRGGRARVEQRTDGHVPANAGEGVKISDPHPLIIGGGA